MEVGEVVALAKVRVYALAKELGISSAELKTHLQELGVPVKTAASTVDEATAAMVKDLLAESAPAKEETKPVEEAPAKEAPVKEAPVKEAPVKEAPVKPRRTRRVTPKPTGLPQRPPVATIMGHVDHGKTTLLDAIRKTNVTEREVGGITQHIGAYQVMVNSKKITFIDTPGHEAFTAMRARGAKVTDVAVLVVAADDGVMPQTIEAIDHARAAEVPIVVVINKIDLPNANSERAKRQLMEHNLGPEEWGGDTVCVEVSATQGTGIDSLLEMIILVAEMAELSADPERLASGTVIEAKLDRRRGPVATILVEDGSLHVGNSVVVGLTSGKVRAMTDHTGTQIKEAGPSAPVEIIGLSEVPHAGDKLEVTQDDRIAKETARARQVEERDERLKESAPRLTLEQLQEQIEAGEVKELRIILKTDVQGTIDALWQALEQLEHPEVKVKIIHAGVGDVSESDVLLASASHAVIIGFHVRIEPQARQVAQDEHVDVRIYQVIYDVIDDIKAAMTGMLEPIYEEVVLGVAEVRALFKISRVGTIAGCFVSRGRVERGADLRVIRDGETIHQGKLDSLKHLKDDVREVAEGYECGIALEGFNNFEVGDIVEVFTQQEVRRETL